MTFCFDQSVSKLPSFYKNIIHIRFCFHYHLHPIESYLTLMMCTKTVFVHKVHSHAESGLRFGEMLLNSKQHINHILFNFLLHFPFLLFLFYLFYNSEICFLFDLEIDYCVTVLRDEMNVLFNKFFFITS